MAEKPAPLPYSGDQMRELAALLAVEQRFTRFLLQIFSQTTYGDGGKALL